MSGRQISYEQLARLPLVGQFERAFHQATGVALRLVPPGTPVRRLSLGQEENGFCRLAAGHAAADTACWKSEAEALRQVGVKLAPQVTRCYAGLHMIATPIVINQHHVATWVGGQVFAAAPTRADFEKLAGQFAKWGLAAELPSVEAAFFSSQVVSACRLNALKDMLAMFARHLGDSAARWWESADAEEPPSVTRAKEFLRAHVTQRVSLSAVAGAASLSQFHLCRLFRTTTGMTITQYLAQLRVERAKQFLSNPALRINEVAYSAGFGSIPHFNSTFRRLAGMSPTDYRAERQRANAPEDATTAQAT